MKMIKKEHRNLSEEDKNKKKIQRKEKNLKKRNKD